MSLPVLPELPSGLPQLPERPPINDLQVQVELPHHLALINECSVRDATKGVDLTPKCLWVKDGVSVWVWITDENNVECFCNITDWMDGDIEMIGVEFARCAYNVLEITARDKTAVFPFVTDMPAIGYWAVGWPRESI